MLLQPEHGTAVDFAVQRVSSQELHKLFCLIKPRVAAVLLLIWLLSVLISLVGFHPEQLIQLGFAKAGPLDSGHQQTINDLVFPLLCQ